ncbi:MAG: carbohydrate binding family 9 domain-containing protein [Saprospiraceae bacterium]|nr:carbohydrate binding family 9 domain-containing protein [Pyrinomonadaceae bacterium]
MKFIPVLCFVILWFGLSGFAQPSPSSTLQPPVVTEMATSANNEGPRYVKKDAPVKIPMLETAPVIDGQLDDGVWQNAAVFGDFIQTQPGDNIAPKHPTEYMMAYDAKNLYIAFRIKQDRNSIRATVARRDNIFNDDYVLMYLDTFNDQRQAYIVSFNPLGIQADGTFTEGRGEDYSVDLLMESKGVLTEDGYTVEAAIPFKSLRYEAGGNKQWGLHIFRRIKYNNNELNAWMPNNRSISGSLNQAGHITGLDGIETTRQLEINPSFTVSASGRRTRFTFNNDPAGRYVNDGIKGEFGMTAKFGLTPTTTLDFAYNPDFAQVEADAPVSAANLRFPVFFAEKRPFFLERIDIFQSGMNVVNTRAIVDPDIAAKLTGRSGKNTFGILYASDNGTFGNLSKDDRESLRRCLEARGVEGAPCPNERIFGKNADIGVLRFKRDIGRQHNLGMFATTYNFVDRHNHTSGFDGRFKLTPKTVAEFQVLGTHTRGFFYNPELDQNQYRTGNGIGYRIYVERSDKNLYMNYLVQGRSADYRADVGFTNRYDTNYAGSFIQYQTDRDAKKKIIFKRLFNATNISYDWKGRTQYFISESQGMLALQRQTFVGVGFQLGSESVYENEFGAVRTVARPNQGAFFGSPKRSANFKAVQAFVESTPNKQFFLFFFVDYTNGQMEYDFGGPGFERASAAYLNYSTLCNVPVPPPSCTGLPIPANDPGPGDQLTFESTVRYQPTTAFQTQLNFTKRRLVRHDTGKLAFDDNVFSSRSTYQFNRDIFARLRVDYSTFTNRARSQLVLGWTPSPGTAIYAGYNDDLNYNGYNPYNGRFEPGLNGNGRSFFIKASYLFRKSF